MKKFLVLPLFIFLVFTVAVIVRPPIEKAVVPEVAEEDYNTDFFSNPFRWWEPWKRPEGPVRIGLQIGHKNQENLPEELAQIRRNTGASAGGYTEVQVNEMVINELKPILEAQGYVVDVLEAPMPKRYWADVFLSIHADGSESRSASGYKIAAPWMDVTGKSDELARLIEQSYGNYVDLPKDDTITRNMRGYYAFNWRRYENSIHPMTHAAIVETGFLTNANDRRIITQETDVVAQGIAEGVIAFVRDELKM